MIHVGILGATGYTGRELAQLLARHPQAQIVFATSQSYAGRLLSDVYPTAPDLRLIAPETAVLDQVDVVFLCLPHAAAAQTAAACLDAGTRVIDLSADFRLQDAGTYAQWYGGDHPAPHWLPEAVYGLTEFARAALPETRLVANPGCYATACLLALQPLLAAAIEIEGTVIIDAKSGVSGAGRTPQESTHFMQVVDNLTPYKIGRSHRHLPEMEQVMATWHPAPPPLIFSPHLLPVPRGILATIYVPLARQWQEADVHHLYHKTYAHEPFVHLLPSGQLATLAHVVQTNRCALSLTLTAQMLIITAAIDNLIKGAAGQAVQNMNVMFGLNETWGLC